MKKVVIIIILSIILVFSLLAVYILYPKTMGKPTVFETEPTTYSVSFELNGTVLSQQTVEEQSLPQPVSTELPGVRITGWTDAQGQPADPFTAAVTADVCYQALFCPELTDAHVPFLFTDEAGMLLPDAPLTHDALTQALNALGEEGAAAYFPTLSQQAAPVTYRELTSILGAFYDASAVSAAFPKEEDPTRAVFAAGMLQLLGRAEEELLTLPEAYTIPADITAMRPDAAILLEASQPHTPADTGISWASLELPSAYDPGFVFLDGRLYYVREDHYLLRDGYVGSLYFNADGLYTSGDAALDETVLSILQMLCAQNPDADRYTMLRVVYDYCHQNYTYRRTFDHPEYGSTGWEIQRAKAMFETTKGNCYSYAAIFWALSRNLGYETRAISGKCLEDEQPHSWCIINLDGEDYIFDPQWQYNYTERGITYHDMFRIPMDKIGYWLYQWVE